MRLANTSDVAVLTRWLRTRFVSEGRAAAERIPSTVSVIINSMIVNPRVAAPPGPGRALFPELMIAAGVGMKGVGITTCRETRTSSGRDCRASTSRLEPAGLREWQ